MWPRRNTRRHRPEVVSAAVQLLECRRVLSGASLTLLKMEAAAPLLQNQLKQSDLQSGSALQLRTELISEKVIGAAVEGSGLISAAVRPAADSVTAFTNAEQVGSRRPLMIHRRGMPDSHQSETSKLPSMASIKMSINIWGTALPAGQELLSVTLDRLPVMPQPQVGGVHVLVIPDGIVSPSVNLPSSDGGLIDVTPLFRSDHAGENTSAAAAELKGLPADTNGQSEDHGRAPVSAIPVSEAEGFVPLSQPATVPPSRRHQTTAAADEGGYIDVVAFASQTDFRTDHVADSRQVSGSRLPHQEIDGAVGRHRTFQIAESNEDFIASADAAARIEAATTPVQPTVRGSGSEAVRAPLRIAEPSPENRGGGTLPVEAPTRVTPSMDNRGAGDAVSTRLPSRLLLPALGVVGALRSGVRRRLRKILTGLIRKI